MLRNRVVRAAARRVRPFVSDETWKRARGVVSEREARAAGADDELTALARKFDTDKWGQHRYTPHYQRHLEHLRGDTFTLLEIGIGGYGAEGAGGGSLRMWQEFFPHARIVGLDIQDKSFVTGERITTVQGDQTDPVVLGDILSRFQDVKVVIDDGSHRPADIRKTFEFLFPRIDDRAVYSIEDMQTSYWPEWGGSEDRSDPLTSMGLVKDLLDGLNWEEFVDDRYKPSYTDKHVTGVHAFHNMVIIQKGRNVEGTARRQILEARYARRR